MQEAEGSGKHRRKGMLVTRSDSINSVSGRRLFYAPCHGGDGISQQRSTYDKERLGVSSNPKKRPSRQSIQKHLFGFFLGCTNKPHVVYVFISKVLEKEFLPPVFRTRQASVVLVPVQLGETSIIILLYCGFKK
jgi:hypothetical protein